jgi:hypothetical protein
VRVFAYALSRIEVPLGEVTREPDPIPSIWPGCYAFRTLTWSREMPDWAVPLHTPPDTFRLHEVRGTESLESGAPLARPRLPPPEWGGFPSAHWQAHGTDSATVVWTNGFTGAVLVLRPTDGGFTGAVRWINDAVGTTADPDADADLVGVPCPKGLAGGPG